MSSPVPSRVRRGVWLVAIQCLLPIVPQLEARALASTPVAVVDARVETARPDGTAQRGAKTAGRPREGADTVHVSPPTGETETDRANVQAAFDAVKPGGTILFASGTYLLGKGVSLIVPDVTVQGHTEGTVLQGCEAGRFDLPKDGGMEAMGAMAVGCTGLFVLADRQTIRGLTFDYTWHGIYVSRPVWLRAEGAPPERGFGGHRIEGNVFRNVPNGIRVVGPTDQVTVIRDNRVENAYHAFTSNGAPVHVLQNRISVPEPETVPWFGYPEGGVILNPGPSADSCRGSRVVGNAIDGTLNGVQVLAGAAGRCRDHEIRDNEIRVVEVALPADYPNHLRVLYLGEDAEGSTVTGTAIRLYGEYAGVPDDPAATITNILIENNRVLGGAGLGIQLVRVSNSRIVGNHISGIRRRSPFPGLTLYDDPSRWRDANGSGIWLSPDSHGNEITGNTFEEVAEAAVVIRGDSNRVVLSSYEDEVRDLGTGNRIRLAGDAAVPTEDESSVLARTGLSGEPCQELDRGPECFAAFAADQHPSMSTVAASAASLPAAHDTLPDAVIRTVTIDGRAVRVLSRLASSGNSREPTVVFEGGSAIPIEAWNDVIAALGDSTPFLAYDPPGIGGSEWDGARPEPSRVAERLERVLDAAGADPPFVLVGHSWAGWAVRAFEGRRPGAVAVLVLIDPTGPSAAFEKAFDEVGADSDDRAAFWRLVADMLQSAPLPIRARQRVIHAYYETGTDPEVPAHPSSPVVVLTAGRFGSTALPGAEELAFDVPVFFDALRKRGTRAPLDWISGAPDGLLVHSTTASHCIHCSDPELVAWAIRRASNFGDREGR